MGFILACILVAILAGAIAWRYSDFEDAKFVSTVFMCCSLVVCTITWGASYSTYIETRTFYNATSEQYFGAVEMYQDHALLDLKGAAGIAFTDFKYEGYQENMAGFINRLRKEVVDYNEGIISKRIMKKNPFFNWMIVAPDDDMKIIKMTSGSTSKAG